MTGRTKSPKDQGRGSNRPQSKGEFVFGPGLIEVVFRQHRSLFSTVRDLVKPGDHNTVNAHGSDLLPDFLQLFNAAWRYSQHINFISTTLSAGAS